MPDEYVREEVRALSAEVQALTSQVVELRVITLNESKRSEEDRKVHEHLFDRMSKLEAKFYIAAGVFAAIGGTAGSVLAKALGVG